MQARYDAELPPFISLVRHPGHPVILGMDFLGISHKIGEINTAQRPTKTSGLKIASNCVLRDKIRIRTHNAATPASVRGHNLSTSEIQVTPQLPQEIVKDTP